MRPKALAEWDSVLREDKRLQDVWNRLDWNSVESLPPAHKKIRQTVILSYPDDEGIRLNNGRPGASEGPERILFYLGRFIEQGSKTPPLYVITDPIRQPYIHERHEIAEKRVSKLLKLNYRVITLGGGHDYGYPDASAYHHITKGKILNVDAHLDVRPVIEGRLNSGTPFYRFIQRFGGKALTHWGIQEQCNARSHLAFAKASSAKIYHWQARAPRLPGLVGLSICLDAFEGIRGVSAPALVGLKPEQGLEVINTYGSRSAWLGLYECAPRYDQPNEDSARLAALFAYRFIHS
jgi:formiminoglutamase